MVYALANTIPERRTEQRRQLLRPGDRGSTSPMDGALEIGLLREPGYEVDCSVASRIHRI